jgi:hypothetical protein
MQALGALGVAPGRFDDKGRVFYNQPTGVFMISKPIDGQPASCANGSTIGFLAKSPQEADAWHAAGLAAGGAAIEDRPACAKAGSASSTLAYLRDPAGNKVCALHRIPA